MEIAPDIVIIRLGFKLRRRLISNTGRQRKNKVQSIIQTLQRMGITDIKTSQYSIDRVYDFEDGRQIDKEFSVRNILQIRTTNLEAAGSIIDAAVNAGANVVDLITFDISNREYYCQQV